MKEADVTSERAQFSGTEAGVGGDEDECRYRGSMTAASSWAGHRIGSTSTLGPRWRRSRAVPGTEG